MAVTDDQHSSYLQYLPALYQEEPEEGRSNDLGRFLLAFEHVLTGLRDEVPGLEEILDGVELDGRVLKAGIERYFDPGLRGPADDPLPEPLRLPDDDRFLHWLAQWIGLRLRRDVDPLIKRRLLARAVELYRLRGTRDGLIALLQMHHPAVDISEPSGWLQVGVESRVEVDTIIEGPIPHHFIVTWVMPPGEGEGYQREISRRTRFLQELIDAEKPAQTSYTLTPPEASTMEVEVRSTVAINTMIG
jgi:hypothetical protein